MPSCCVLELVYCLPLPLTQTMFALAPGRKPSTNIIAPQPLSSSDNITTSKDNDSTIMDIISFAVAVAIAVVAIAVLRCDDNILQ